MKLRVKKLLHWLMHVPRETSDATKKYRTSNYHSSSPILICFGWNSHNDPSEDAHMQSDVEMDAVMTSDVAQDISRILAITAPAVDSAPEFFATILGMCCAFSNITLP